MSRRAFPIVAAVLLAALSRAGAQPPSAEAPVPTWQEIMASGIVPYRQLTVEDFAIDDTVHPKHGFYIKTAIEPRYHFILKPHTTGFVYAYIDRWLVFSGFNKNESSRKSKLKTMKAELPFAQGLLDISEINARRLAALPLGDLPSGRGANFDEARADMENKLTVLLEQRFRENQAEMDAFSKATKGGADKKKVRQLAAEIRKRLDATPPTTVQPNEAPPPAVPSPSASASPSATPASTPAIHGYAQ